jgi:hypothetical protein
MAEPKGERAAASALTQTARRHRALIPDFRFVMAGAP